MIQKLLSGEFMLKRMFKNLNNDLTLKQALQDKFAEAEFSETLITLKLAYKLFR